MADFDFSPSPESGQPIPGVEFAKQTRTGVNGRLDKNGNAISADKLITARKINGELFDGTADIIVSPAYLGVVSNFNDATLSGYYLASSSAINSPLGLNYRWTIFNLVNFIGEVHQTAIARDPGVTFHAVRTKDEKGVWSVWKQVTTSAWGTVNNSGIKVIGDNFSSVKLAQGKYKITMTNGFSNKDAYSVVASVSELVSGLAFASAIAVNTNGTTFEISVGGSTLFYNLGVSFIVMG